MGAVGAVDHDELVRHAENLFADFRQVPRDAAEQGFSASSNAPRLAERRSDIFPSDTTASKTQEVMMASTSMASGVLPSNRPSSHTSTGTATRNRPPMLFAQRSRSSYSASRGCVSL